MQALIHSFEVSDTPPYFDDEGDQLLGSYYQFINEDDEPISDLIGPYRTHKDAEKAAQRAYTIGDF
jgi:hypothetical protein